MTWRSGKQTENGSPLSDVGRDHAQNTADTSPAAEVTRLDTAMDGRQLDTETIDHLRAELAFAMKRIDELATENAGLRKRLAVGGWQG